MRFLGNITNFSVFVKNVNGDSKELSCKSPLQLFRLDKDAATMLLSEGCGIFRVQKGVGLSRLVSVFYNNDKTHWVFENGNDGIQFRVSKKTDYSALFVVIQNFQKEVKQQC